MIYEQYEDEALVLEDDFDTSIPFSVILNTGEREPDILVYPSLRSQAEAFLQRFGKTSLFSDEALLWAKENFGVFLADHGFEIGEESDDFYLNFRIDKVNPELVRDTTQLLNGVGELENLTEYDVDALCELGYVCFGTVIDGKIVSAACTNLPIEEGVALGEMEIGVETSLMYRSKGYGSSNVAALAQALASRGCSTLYECASKNTASHRLVERLGGVEYARKYYIVGFKV